jgi:hypothetical protein
LGCDITAVAAVVTTIAAVLTTAASESAIGARAGLARSSVCRCLEATSWLTIEKFMSLIICIYMIVELTDMHLVGHHTDSPSATTREL